MNLRKKIKEKINKNNDYVTAGQLAHSLRTDIGTIKKTLYEMNRTGEIKLTTLEKIINRGK